MREYISGLIPDKAGHRWYEAIRGVFTYKGHTGNAGPEDTIPSRQGPILPNVWLGITVCNQEEADQDIPKLLAIPAGKRFLSIEPMLGYVDLCGISFDRHTTFNILDGCGIDKYALAQSIPNAFLHETIDWVIVGGETGPNARPMHPEWVRSIRDQCADANVPFLFKQWGSWFPRSQWEYNPTLILPGDECVGWGNSVFQCINTPDETFHLMSKILSGRLLDGKLHDEFPT
jgi:hypothetical protein